PGGREARPVQVREIDVAPRLGVDPEVHPWRPEDEQRRVEDHAGDDEPVPDRATLARRPRVPPRRHAAHALPPATTGSGVVAAAFWTGRARLSDRSASSGRS